MVRSVSILLRLLAISLLLLAVACGPSEEELAAEARAEEMTWLDEAHAALTDKRAELAELAAKVTAGEEGLELAEGQSAEDVLAELQTQYSSLENETFGQAEEFMQRLVNYINEDPMEQGAEPTPEQLKALRMKSGEDLVLAAEYVEKGGEYSRAIEIVERALGIDPDNPELKAALTSMDEARYMTDGRLAQIDKGMTQGEVRALLGPIPQRNERDYQDGKLQAWFYPKRPEEGQSSGGAAAVYFQQQKGQWKVYRTDYNAVKAQEAES